MKLFKRAAAEPAHDEAFAQRLGQITGRTRHASDPYAEKQDQAPVAA